MLLHVLFFTFNTIYAIVGVFWKRWVNYTFANLCNEHFYNKKLKTVTVSAGRNWGINTWGKNKHVFLGHHFMTVHTALPHSFYLLHSIPVPGGAVHWFI